MGKNASLTSTISRQSAELKRMREALDLSHSISKTHCSQCGNEFETSACGPTHAQVHGIRKHVQALIWNARLAKDWMDAGLPTKPDETTPTPAPAEPVAEKSMNENILGGRGTCRYCGVQVNNVAYHEAQECRWTRSHTKDCELSKENALGYTSKGICTCRPWEQTKDQPHSELMEAQKEIASLKSKLAERADVTREELEWLLSTAATSPLVSGYVAASQKWADIQNKNLPSRIGEGEGKL